MGALRAGDSSGAHGASRLTALQGRRVWQCAPVKQASAHCAAAALLFPAGMGQADDAALIEAAKVGDASAARAALSRGANVNCVSVRALRAAPGAAGGRCSPAGVACGSVVCGMHARGALLGATFAPPH